MDDFHGHRLGLSGAGYSVVRGLPDSHWLLTYTPSEGYRSSQQRCPWSSLRGFWAVKECTPDPVYAKGSLTH